MKIIIIILYYSFAYSKPTKSQFIYNSNGCHGNFYTDSKYNKFHKLAYAQFLTDQITYFQKKLHLQFTQIEQSDEKVFNIVFNSYSQEVFNVEVLNNNSYKIYDIVPLNAWMKLVKLLDKFILKNLVYAVAPVVNFLYNAMNKFLTGKTIQQMNKEKLELLEQYFIKIENDKLLEQNKENEIHMKNYFFNDQQNQSPYKKTKIDSLLHQLEIQEQKDNLMHRINVDDNEKLQKSAIAFKINLQVQGKIKQTNISFILMHVVSFQQNEINEYFKNEIYFIQHDLNQHFSSHLDVNINNAISLQKYLAKNREDRKKNHIIKLDLQNFYSRTGMKEVQQSCINALSGLRQGIGVALSNLIGYYYGYYNISLDYSLVEEQIIQKTENDENESKTFQQIDNIAVYYDYLDYFNTKNTPYTIKNNNNLPQVKNILYIDQDQIQDAELHYQIEGTQDNLAKDFVYGCKSFKDSFDYFIQNKELSKKIFYIQRSNYIKVECKDNDNESGFLSFRGKNVMRIQFSRYDVKKQREDEAKTSSQNQQDQRIVYSDYEMCFKSQFVLSQLIKQSLMCVDLPLDDELQQIHDKDDNFQSFYQFYYNKPIKELYDVTEILQNMIANSLNVEILYEALLYPFIAENLQAVKSKEDYEQIIKILSINQAGDMSLPFLEIVEDLEQFSSRRGLILTVKGKNNTLYHLTVKIIEGEQDFLKIVFSNGSQDKEFLFNKFVLEDEFLEFFDSQEDSNDIRSQVLNSIVKKKTQEEYLGQIAKYLKEQLALSQKEKLIINHKFENKDNEQYTFDDPNDIMEFYSSLQSITLQEAFGIFMFQLLSINFEDKIEELNDDESNDTNQNNSDGLDTRLEINIKTEIRSVFLLVAYYQSQTQMEKSINFQKNTGKALEESVLETNFKQIENFFKIDINYIAPEDDNQVSTFDHFEPVDQQVSYKELIHGYKGGAKIGSGYSFFKDLQNFVDKLCSTREQSEWLFLEDKLETERLSNDYFMYFQMPRTTTNGLLKDKKHKENFLESFAIGVRDKSSENRFSFLLGDRESNRYLIVSMNGLETQQTQMFSISFYCIYFRSEFMIFLSDFQSFWDKITEMIISVAGHYREIARQATDMTFDEQHISLEDIKQIIENEQKKLSLSNHGFKMQAYDSEKLIYIMPGIDQNKAQTVLIVGKKKFRNKRHGYQMRFFDSKFPANEKNPNEFLQDKMNRTQHNQLEFYANQNFDYKKVLSLFIKENLELLVK